MSALGLVTAAYGAWKWSGNDRPVDWLLSTDGTPMHWTAVDAPAATVILSSMGGFQLMKGVAHQRGLQPRVPWKFWLGMLPAAAALGAEGRAMDRGGLPTRAEEVTVAAGTAAAAAWFTGVALWENRHLPESGMTATRGEPVVEALGANSWQQPRCSDRERAAAILVYAAAPLPAVYYNWAAYQSDDALERGLALFYGDGLGVAMASAGAAVHMRCREDAVPRWGVWATGFVPAIASLFLVTEVHPDKPDAVLAVGAAASAAWFGVLAFTDLGYERPAESGGASLVPAVAPLRTPAGWAPALVLHGRF